MPASVQSPYRKVAPHQYSQKQPFECLKDALLFEYNFVDCVAVVKRLN